MIKSVPFWMIMSGILFTLMIICAFVPSIVAMIIVFVLFVLGTISVLIAVYMAYRHGVK